MNILMQGDCLQLMRDMPERSVDSVVTDPPYGLSFMGKHWDQGTPGVDFWREMLRVLKPGGHLLAFGGTRTYHRMAYAIEDAGFDIRDQIMWVYGSGFPKSLNVAKSIEGLLTIGSANKTAFKHLSGEQVNRGNCGINKQQYTHGQRDTNYDDTAGDTRLGDLTPLTTEAKQWQGWGTALKPSHEPICMARKPLVNTVAANVLQFGTGALNIDECRVKLSEGDDSRLGGKGDWSSDKKAKNVYGGGYVGVRIGSSKLGRWPANLLHDGSDEVMVGFPYSKGQLAKARTDGEAQGNNVYSAMNHVTNQPEPRNDTGSAARFFYCAKASKKDREEGNNHPTVKPTDLMRYLCRLVTPPGGVLLDPFMGSGSTGKAAVREGFFFIGIEQDEKYFQIAKARIQNA